jgi:hypothetical protein
VNSVAGGSAAVLTGTSSWVQGQIANAFGFDGFSYLFVGNYAKANRALSASGWVNVAAGVASDVAFVRNAIGAIGINPAGQFELGLVYNVDTGEARLSAAIGSGPNIIRATAPDVFPTGSFQQVGFTADGAQLRLYVNGVEVASTDYQGTINAPGIPWLSMGARLSNDDQDPPVLGPDGTNPNYLAGPLDDLGIWNRRLTADELSQIFAIGKQGKPLTDVVVVPPVNPVISSVTANANGTITVTYAGGVLEASPSLAGPYAPVQGASSPYTFTPTTPNWFGRVRN